MTAIFECLIYLFSGRPSVIQENLLHPMRQDRNGSGEFSWFEIELMPRYAVPTNLDHIFYVMNKHNRSRCADYKSYKKGKEIQCQQSQSDDC